MRRIFMLLAVSLLAACSAPKYTVDDGRKVNEELLGHIRSFGAGEQALRPAIARSAALKDPHCDTQWELPFSVATSYGLGEDDRMAWVRGLGVDERMTVVGTVPGLELYLRDKIQEVAGYSRENSAKMLLALNERREAGAPFDLKLSSGKTLRVTPFKVCRGFTRLAPPVTPKAQNYHWLGSLHPLEVARVELTDDEALWAVLWTQGLSEEGGARMKTYHYTTKIVGGIYEVATIVSGLQGAALAANAAVIAGQTIAAKAATEILKKQLVDQASALATSKIRSELANSAQRLTQKQTLAAMQQVAANRGSLSGVSWVASSVFDRADAWAYAQAEKLNANPLAGFLLHQKLLEQGLTANSLVLDAERLAVLSKLAHERGQGDTVIAILGGVKPEELQAELAGMPLASVSGEFSYDDTSSSASAGQTYFQDLGKSLSDMPLASVSAP